WQEGRVRCAVALGLGGFVEPLPLEPGLDVLAVDLLAEGLYGGEHAAVAQVAVVGDREAVAGGLGFRGRHPFPEVLGLVAAEGRLGGVGLDQARLGAVLAEEDVAVKVVALGIRGPVVPDYRRE